MGDHHTADTSSMVREPEKPGTTRLIVFADGMPAEHVLPDAGPVVIGRGKDAQIVVEHPSVSRRHAILHLGDDVRVTDTGSRNGTVVKGQRLAKDESALVPINEPFTLGHILCVVRRAGVYSRVERARAMQRPNDRVDKLVELVAQSDISVVIHGETGVGKEVTARRIHTQSKRKAQPFVGINCAALPETLLESELFGYERGAFSGADRPKPGLFEAAEHGTLFLDEVAEMSASVQAKLLRVIEERQVQRLGALKPRAIDVRFVAASHAFLEDEVADGRFREDLFYRLNGITIELPALRDRKDEIVGFAQQFLSDAAKHAGRAAPRLSETVQARLLAHAWPGNIRELKNTMDRAFVLAAGADTIDGEHVPLSAPRRARPLNDSTTQTVVPHTGDDERSRVLAALKEAAGNQKRAADILGISRRTLINRLEQFQIPRPRKT